MDCANQDSSGTDDDLPMQNISRNTLGSRFSMSGRVPAGPISRGIDATDMKFQIHGIETEAYSAILRAFIAQSDVLSWTHFRDGQWGGDMAVFSVQGNVGQSVKSNRQAPSADKGRGPMIHATDFKKRSDMIEIRATDKLIHEVERVVYGGEDPDPVQVEKAKLILKEHERAILEALDKLADVSDGEESPDRLRHHYSHKELQRSGQRSMTHHALYGQADRLDDYYYSKGFGRDHTDGAGIPRIDVQEDEETP